MTQVLPSLKIMHVMAGAPQGGAENIFLESVLALAQARLSQYVVTRPDNTYRLDQLRANNIPLSTASFDRIARWSTHRTLRKAIASFDPDIIQYWMGRAGTFAQNSRAINIGWYGGYYKMARFAKCEFHIGLTKDIVAHIHDQGATPAQTKLIHTYAEFSPCAPTPRSSLETPENAPLLLALARLHVKKGLDIALNALTQIPDAYLWIAGDGPLKDELTELAKRLGLTERVRFLGWRDDRGALLAAADICIFPSRYEPFGTVMVDAWAAGAPLVAAAAAGPKAYVKTEENGLLIDIDDADALARAIMRILRDDRLRLKLIEGGRKTYRSQFTKEVFINTSAEFYQSALAQKSADP